MPRHASQKMLPGVAHNAKVLFETILGLTDNHKGRGAAKLIDLCFDLPGEASVMFPIKFCSFKRVSSTVRDDEFNLVTRGWSQTQGYRLWIEPVGKEGNFLRVNVGTITERRPHFVICEMKYRLVLTEALNVHNRSGAPDIFPVPPPDLISKWTMKLAMNEQAMRLGFHHDTPKHLRQPRAFREQGYLAPPPNAPSSSSQGKQEMSKSAKEEAQNSSPARSSSSAPKRSSSTRDSPSLRASSTHCRPSLSLSNQVLSSKQAQTKKHKPNKAGAELASSRDDVMRNQGGVGRKTAAGVSASAEMKGSEHKEGKARSLDDLANILFRMNETNNAAGNTEGPSGSSSASTAAASLEPALSTSS